MQIIRRTTLSLAILFATLISQSTWVSAEDEISVSILSPKEGEVVKPGPVEIHYTFGKGSRGDHVHFYVDGKFTKTSKKESGTLWDLPPGRHVIELRGATREANEEHKEMGKNSKITIDVSGLKTTGVGMKAQR
ncbi:MAG: hypothetical protein HY036_04290 [Nitrospirae bacterium]|nr:hypothetical protein [Nitrospirota bacterium]MBI3351778.1 hypothetical protein [Nitrospirota bacterium]